MSNCVDIEFSTCSGSVGFLWFQAGKRWNRPLSSCELRIVFQLQADAMHRTCTERWSVELIKMKFISKALKLLQAYLVTVVMTFSVQSCTRNVFDHIKIWANRQQHGDSNETRWWWVPWNWGLWMILQNLPQPPQRSRVDQLKVCVSIPLHKLLIVSEQIKVGFFSPLFKSSIIVPWIPCGERDISEQRRLQEIKLGLANHLWKCLQWNQSVWFRRKSSIR